MTVILRTKAWFPIGPPALRLSDAEETVYGGPFFHLKSEMYAVARRSGRTVGRHIQAEDRDACTVADRIFDIQRPGQANFPHHGIIESARAIEIGCP